MLRSYGPTGRAKGWRIWIDAWALAQRDPQIRKYSTLERHQVKVGTGLLEYRNTNLLIGKSDWDIVVQKTGFTNDAGECLVLRAMIEDRPVDMILLNSFGTLTRTADARRVRKWMAAQSEPLSAAASGDLAKK